MVALKAWEKKENKVEIEMNRRNRKLTEETMEEDIELSLSPPVRKANPKQGRRAALVNANDANSGNFLEETTASMNNLRSRPVSGDLFLDDGKKNQPNAGPPLHGRRTGGWADENSRFVLL